MVTSLKEKISIMRQNNKGWRIDYIMITKNLKINISSASILDDVKHSDHCPIVVELNN